MFPSLVKGAGTREYWEDTVILLIWGGTGSHAPSMRHPNETLSLSPCECVGYICVWWVVIVAVQRAWGHEISQTGAETNGDETEPRRGGTQVMGDA
jgi:hypothetical protein